jgi:hypothetical protein
LVRLALRELPRYLAGVLGEEEAAALLGKMAWRATVDVFGRRGEGLGSGLDGVVELFRADGSHPLGVVEAAERLDESTIVLRLSGDVGSLAVAGLVAGLLRGF